MDNKIKVSTINMTADVEVINVCARLISKCIKAKLVLDRAEEKSMWTNENGNVSYTIIDEKSATEIFETVKPFIDELANAFEE